MGPASAPTVLAGLLAILSGLWTINVVVQPGEVWYGEAVIHDQAGRLLRGEPLYQPVAGPPYTVAAYTPLFYAVAAALQLAFGPGFMPGRILSVSAGLASTALVGTLARQYTRDRRLAMLAALLFLGLNSQWERGAAWWSYYKQDSLGVACALAAITLLAGGATRRRVLIAGVFAGLAILTKQTLLAASLAGTLWLWRHDRKSALTFAAASLLVALVPCLGLEVATRAFFANTVWSNANPSSLEVLHTNLGFLLLTQVGPIGVCLLYLLRRRRDPRPHADGLLVTYWACTAIPLLGLVKVGATYNYWLELAAATAALAAVGIKACFTGRQDDTDRRRAVLPTLLLGIHLVLVLAWSGRVVGEPLVAGHLLFAPDRAYDAEFGALVERVRAEPREVLGHSFDVVTLAGRPNLFEPDIYSIFYDQGRWDPAPLVERILAGDVGLLVLSHSLDDVEYWTRQPIAWWPEPVIAALRTQMVLESRLAGRWVYVARPGS